MLYKIGHSSIADIRRDPEAICVRQSIELFLILASINQNHRLGFYVIFSISS